MNHSCRVCNLILLCVIVLLLVIVAGGVLLARSRAMALIHPARRLPQETPSLYGIETWENMTFESADGLRLVGWFIPPMPEADGATLIFVHGFGSNRAGLLAQAAMLHEQRGYGALLFDLRNHGESEGTVTTMGLYEVRDVQGAFDYLLTRPDVNENKIALVGESLGAATVILAAAEMPQVRAVIAQAAYASLEDNIEEGVRRLAGLPPFPFAPLVIGFAQAEAGGNISQVRPIDDIASIAPRPILLLHGSEDALIAPENSERLYEAAGEPKQRYVFEGAPHSRLYSADEDAFEAVVLPFLDMALRPEAESLAAD